MKREVLITIGVAYLHLVITPVGSLKLTDDQRGAVLAGQQFIIPKPLVAEWLAALDAGTDLERLADSVGQRGRLPEDVGRQGPLGECRRVAGYRFVAV